MRLLAIWILVLLSLAEGGAFLRKVKKVGGKVKRAGSQVGGKVKRAGSQVGSKVRRKITGKKKQQPLTADVADPSDQAVQLALIEESAV